MMDFALLTSSAGVRLLALSSMPSTNSSMETCVEGGTGRRAQAAVAVCPWC